MTKYMYNNIINTNIAYIFFEFNNGNHQYVSLKKDIDFYFDSNTIH